MLLCIVCDCIRIKVQGLKIKNLHVALRTSKAGFARNPKLEKRILRFIMTSSVYETYVHFFYVKKNEPKKGRPCCSSYGQAIPLDLAGCLALLEKIGIERTQTPCDKHTVTLKQLSILFDLFCGAQEATMGS